MAVGGLQPSSIIPTSPLLQYYHHGDSLKGWWGGGAGGFHDNDGSQHGDGGRPAGGGASLRALEAPALHSQPCPGRAQPKLLTSPPLPSPPISQVRALDPSAPALDLLVMFTA